LIRVTDGKTGKVIRVYARTRLVAACTFAGNLNTANCTPGLLPLGDGDRNRYRIEFMGGNTSEFIGKTGQ